jgi:hypothetical protein
MAFILFSFISNNLILLDHLSLLWNCGGRNRHHTLLIHPPTKPSDLFATTCAAF